MSDSGYTATEKTKILYEESLKDIRELTQRLEAVSVVVMKANRMADLQGERSRAAQRISSDVTAAQRHKSFVWAAGSMTVFGMTLFGAGMALGSVGFGVGFLAAIALGIGLVTGLVLCQVLVAGEQVALIHREENKTIQSKEVTEFVWTKDLFFRATQEVWPTIKIHSKEFTACHNVLFNNKSVSDAAKNEKMLPAAVERLLAKLKIWQKYHDNNLLN